MATSYLHTPLYLQYKESRLYTALSANMRANNGETFPQHWVHSELFTMLMGWALDLLSFVVCLSLVLVLVVILKLKWLG